ncbi:MAG: 6-bladed beta-propeller [Acidobacteria bacterium]|nr:6-bladed beta-propeller [Acidobacteriota bacterium]
MFFLLFWLSLGGRPTIESFFPLEKMIVLEETDEAVIVQAGQVLVADQVIYVVDRSQGFVFSYDLEGKFLGIIGAKGQGPGEYLSAERIFIGPDQSLGVLDIYAGSIIFYRKNGAYLTSMRATGGGFPLASDVLYQDSKLYLFGIKGGPFCGVGKHGIFNFSGFSELSLQTCFGNNIQEQTLLKFGHIAFQPVVRPVGHQFWFFHPYHNEIECYGMNGEKLSSFHYPDVELMQWSEVSQLNSENDLDVMAREKNRLIDLIPLEDKLVVEKTSLFGKQRFVVYDLIALDGKPLAQRLRYAGPVLCQSDGMLLSFFGLFDSELGRSSQRKSYPDEYQYLEKASIPLDPDLKIIRMGKLK